MRTDQMLLHVKWFTGEETSIPNFLSSVVNGPFLFWLSVTLFGLLVTSIFNEPLQRIPLIKRIHDKLDLAKPYLDMIFRIGLGIGLLMQLISSTYLAPEFHIEQNWITALMIVAIASLLVRRTLPISGLAIVVLYGYTLFKYGWFHSLDYLFYVGIIYYLLVSGTRWKATAIPALYLFTGFALAWVAMEKFTMPELAYDIIHHYDIPTFGFSAEHFVLISAFIEVGLAWSFIVGILSRFVSIVVTLVFITTTTVFGYTEVVGHTVLHTIFVMFLIGGEGTFKTPFQFHHSLVLRCLFVLVNFCVLLFGMMWLYVLMGR